MKIDEFFFKSVGEWNSMRSGHSLAFQEFEEIRSKIKIIPIKPDDTRVIKLLKDNLITPNDINQAYVISWKAKSEWGDETQKKVSAGESILIPLEISKTVHELLSSEKRSKIFLYLWKPDIFISMEYKFHLDKNEKTLLSRFYPY